MKVQDKDTITLPLAFQKYEKLESICFGTTYISCIFKFKDVNQILISENIYTKLLIPFEANSSIFIHEETLYIAPLIGIFTAGFTDSLLRPIGERSLFFADLLYASENHTFTFVFGGHHINWNDGTIDGYFFTHDRWIQQTIPFPHVIHDRLPNRQTENHKGIKRIKEKFQLQYSIPWFNPGFFNKWDIHQLLLKNKNVSKYLPDTQDFTSFHQVEEMLGKYGHVYIKPKEGSLGARIYQIIYEREEGYYYCRFYKNEQKKLHKYSTLEYLVHHLFQQEKIHDFIVQQGISLIKLDNQSIDFRVHTNKNNQGIFEVSAIAGKKAGLGSMTTHTALGGEIKTVEELFSTIEEQEEIIEKLSSTALLLSEEIDLVVPGIIGEIGFDIGIDQEGRQWFFEANSKPGRTIFNHPNLEEFDKKTRELFLSYAYYLTEKSIKEVEDITT